MNVDLQFLERDLINASVPVPHSGTLSGHAAGEPFDKHVFAYIKKKYPGLTYRQFEYLNYLYANNSEAITHKARFALLEAPALSYLLRRGLSATKTWTANTPFEEKQNDIADILVIKNGFFNIIDVKTFNKLRKGQPPNIISAYKLAKMCALMLDSKRFDTHDITYIGITWEQRGKKLVCAAVSIKELFKTNPGNLYINWAAALQIQFHVSSLEQSFDGAVEDWCKQYLLKFVTQAKARSQAMIGKFVTPFEPYL